MSVPNGHRHILSHVIRHAADIFTELGFEMADGPEAETEWYNFDALNVPADHPARDMQDTFWLEPLEKRRLLRTHTSPMQIRYMQTHEPPIRIIVPGRVFRNEATDATHEAQFYQIEGLYIDRDASLAHLKGVLTHFFTKLFGKEIGVRLRPSFFPFVEPGIEIDMSCFKCGGRGCPLCKATGWVEIMGAGMVHPRVLENGFKDTNVNPKEWQGFAFGFGVERLAMLRYGIDDLRHFSSGDLRFVNQF